MDDGRTRDLPGVELDEIHRSWSHNDSPTTESKKTPSHASSLTGSSFIGDDDEHYLIPHQDSKNFRQKPNEPPDDDGASAYSRKRRFRSTNWKVDVTMSALMTTAILLVNSVLTAWVSVSSGLKDGIGTVYTGSCCVVGAWSFWLHVVINALGSGLPSVSDYTMQCVTAPTRRECYFAHAGRDWLDVGVPSVRNLFRISWKRRIMWTLLVLSSTPVHLLYSSAVFKIRTTISRCIRCGSQSPRRWLHHTVR